MSAVRLLVGTRKGAFILTSDGKREDWKVSGPHFAGWEIYHLKGSPVDPDRIYASQSTSWFGQMVQRSDDGGETWEPVGKDFVYDGTPGTHQWYDGTQHPVGVQARLASRTIVDRSGHRLRRGGRRRSLPHAATAARHGRNFPGCASAKGKLWQPGAGGMCLHTILLDPSNPERIFVAISAAGAFRTDDGWQDLESDKQGTEVSLRTSRLDSRGRPLRSPDRDASIAP